MAALYYRIWADAITSTKSKKAEANSWKLYTIVPLSLLMGINLFTFFLWMKSLVNNRLPLIFPVEIFSSRPINSFISIILTFFAPFVILNYLLIFNNDRYKEILPANGNQQGKLYKKYVLISIGVLAIPVLIVKLFFHAV
jgi:hypothetical protein